MLKNAQFLQKVGKIHHNNIIKMVDNSESFEIFY